MALTRRFERNQSRYRSTMPDNRDAFCRNGVHQREQTLPHIADFEFHTLIVHRCTIAWRAILVKLQPLRPSACTAHGFKRKSHVTVVTTSTGRPFSRVGSYFHCLSESTAA